MNNQNNTPLSYISIGGYNLINRKIPPSEYPELLRWGIRTGYAQVKEYQSGRANQSQTSDGFRYYVKDKIAFSLVSKSNSPLDIFVYERDIYDFDDLYSPRFLAFTGRKWVVKGLWEFDIDAYFYRLKKIRADIEGNKLRDKLKQQEKERKSKQSLINSAEISYYKKLQPTIKLLGNNPMEIPLGFTYHEHGAYAHDIYDDDITDSIKIDSNKLDSLTKGKYEVEYAVNDNYGNTGKMYRTVYVV